MLYVNMPEIDGYEACKRLKSREGFAEIPVILLSALSGLDDKVIVFHPRDSVFSWRRGDLLSYVTWLPQLV